MVSRSNAGSLLIVPYNSGFGVVTDQANSSICDSIAWTREFSVPSLPGAPGVPEQTNRLADGGARGNQVGLLRREHAVDAGATGSAHDTHIRESIVEHA